MKLFRNISLYLGIATLFAIILITLLQIVLRAFFNIPMSGSEEFARFLFVAFIFLGLPYYYRADGHIQLGGINNLISLKNQRLLKIIIQLFCILVFTAILFSAISTTVTNYKSTTPTLSIPFWIFFMPILFGFALLLAEHVKDFFNALNKRD
jgi:TRAP-type C4-dicarboxylate transport system permease small subunit